MNKLLILIALFSFSSVQYLAQSRAPESDFQVWNETQIVVPLKKTEDKKNDQISMIFFGALRAGRNSSRLVDERVGVGFQFRVNKYFNVTPSILYRAGQPFEGRKEYETRLRFDATVERGFKSFSLSNRGRIEHRLRNSRSDSTRFRNKIQLTVPVKKEGKEIFAPFVATEPFYEFQSKQWTRNEFSVGIKKKFNSNFSADFFYMLQNNRGNAFRYINIVGVNFKIKID